MYMNYLEAIKTNKYVRRPSWDEGDCFCFYKPLTGPYKDLVDCDYFVFIEDGFISFSTSGPDLYSEDLLAQDYEVVNMEEKKVLEIKKATEKLEKSHN